jgi:cell division protein FtsB
VASRSKKSVSRRPARARRRRQRTGARRFVLFFLLGLIALLYAGPLRAYYDKRELVNQQRTQVELLKSAKSELKLKLREASTLEAAEREARRLWYAKPGEHLYIVKGIDEWRKSRARAHQ